MAMQKSPVVGVFDDRAQAERAIEALNNAGVPADQIRYSHAIAGNSGFLASIKNLFSSQERSGNAIIQDLTGMGLSQEEAHNYAQRYEAGRTIVAVALSRNMPDVLSIMRNSGAHTYERQPGMEGGGATGGVTQPSNAARTAPIRKDDATASPIPTQSSPSSSSRAAQSFSDQGMAAQRDPSFTGDPYNQGMAAQKDFSLTGGASRPAYDQTEGTDRQDRDTQPDFNRSEDDKTPLDTTSTDQMGIPEWRDMPPASSQRAADWDAQSSSNTGRQEVNKPPIYGDPTINPGSTPNRTGDPGMPSDSRQDVQKGSGMRSIEQEIRDKFGMRKKETDPDIQRGTSDTDQDFQSGRDMPDDHDADRRGMFDRGV